MCMSSEESNITSAALLYIESSCRKHPQKCLLNAQTVDIHFRQTTYRAIINETYGLDMFCFRSLQRIKTVNKTCALGYLYNDFRCNLKEHPFKTSNFKIPVLPCIFLCTHGYKEHRIYGKDWPIHNIVARCA